MRVVDQGVARTFPSLVLPGGKNSLITTDTEKLIGNRFIRRQVRFINCSTNKRIQSTSRHEISFLDQLRSGFLCETCDDTFLQTGTGKMPGHCFPCLHLHITGETVNDLRLNKTPSRVTLPSGVCQKPGELGFHPASNTEQMVAEIGPVA